MNLLVTKTLLTKMFFFSEWEVISHIINSLLTNLVLSVPFYEIPY